MESASENSSYVLVNVTRPPQANSVGEDMLVGFVILIWATVGVIVNAGIAFILTQTDNTNPGFNKLMASLACADCGVMTLFALWVAPMTFLQREGLSMGIVGKKVGQVILIFSTGSYHSTLLIAANRFAAITRPGKYGTLFGDQATRKYIKIAWATAMLFQLLYFIPGCDFFYLPSIRVWLFADTACGWYLAYVVDLGYLFFLACIIGVLNIATFLSIRRYRQQKSNHQDPLAKEKRQQEIRFFIQSTLNVALLMYCIVSFHIISRFTTTMWGLFVTITFTWQTTQASNGFLIFFINPKVRARVWEMFGAKKVAPLPAAGKKIHVRSAVATDTANGSK